MICTNPDCPDFIATGKPSEYDSEIVTCPRCNIALVQDDSITGSDLPNLETLRNQAKGFEPAYESTEEQEVQAIREKLIAASIPFLDHSAELFNRLKVDSYRPEPGSRVFLVPNERIDETLNLLEQFETNEETEKNDEIDQHKPVGDTSKLRLGAMFVDHLLISILALFVGGLLSDQSTMLRSAVIVSSVLSYFFILEGMWGTTLGKMFFGLRVVRSDGSKGGWVESLIRTALRLIEVNPILLGALPGAISVLATRSNQRIGDLLSGAFVVHSSTNTEQ